MKLFFFFLIGVFILPFPGQAQRKLNNLPTIPGYKTLKADLHIHTVFSDGEVWPTFRVDEAAREGFDIIAITDHIEYLPHQKYIAASHNASYEIASVRAREQNMILIKGVEITRPMPTGHFNALFIQDADKLVHDDFWKVMEEANRQGAFVFWNHPGWKKQQPDGSPKFQDAQLELLRRGWLHGIEYYNTKCAYGFVLDWCAEKNLTVLSNSDVHIAVRDFWEFDKGGVRPATLIFARERTEASVKEALIKNQTLAFYGRDSLAGKREWAEAFFKSSLDIRPPYYENGETVSVEIVNHTSLTYHLENTDLNHELKSITLEPFTVNRVRFKKTKTPFIFRIRNIRVASDQFLETSLKLLP